MSSLLRRSGKGYAWNQAARTADYLLTYLLGLVIARGLGDELYGSFVIFISVSQILLVLTSAGLESSVPATAAKLFRPGETGLKRGGVAWLFLLRTCLFSAAALVVLLLREELAALLGLPQILLEYFLLLVAYAGVRSLVLLAVTLLTASLRTRRVAIVTLVVRTAEVLLAFVILRSGGGLAELFLLLTAANLAQLLAYVGPWREVWSFGEPGVSREVVTLGGKFWIISISEFLLGRQADVLILGYFLIGTAAIAHYDIGIGLAQGVNMALTIGFQGIAVATFSFVGPDEKQLSRSYWGLFSKTTILMTVPALVFCLIAAREIVLFLYTAEFEESVPLLQAFAGFLIGTRLLAGGTAANYLAAAQRTDLLLRSSLASGLLNLALAFILVPRYGVSGAVIATGAGALVIAGIHARYSTRLLSARLPWRTGFIVLTASVGAALLARFLCEEADGPRLLCLAILFVVVFLLFAYILKPISWEDARLMNGISPLLKDVAKRFARADAEKVTIKGKTLRLYDRQKWAFAWLPHVGTVLDVGSSLGPLAALLSRKATVAVACDVDLIALKALGEGGSATAIVHADGQNLPVRRDAADAVLLLDVLEHVDNGQDLLAEIQRVLRPGGTLILSVPNKGLFRFLDPQNLSRRLRVGREESVYHPHFSWEEIQALLADRFTVVEKRYGGLFLYPVCFAAANFFRKHLNVDAASFLGRLGDIDNDISWGSLSYNLMIHATTH